MSELTKKLKILGLSEQEAVVVASLSKSGRQSVAELARNVSLPRMTTFDTLNRLNEKGFVRPVSVGRRTEWKSTDISKLQSRFNSVFLLMKQESGEADELQMLKQMDAKDIGLHYFRGKQQIKSAYEQIFCERTQSSQVYAIDGANFFTDYFKYLSELESEISFAESVRKSGNIFRVLMTESNLTSLKEAYLPPEVYRAMFSAPLSIQMLPDEALTTASEISIFEDRVTILIPKRLTLIIVSQPDLVLALRGLYNALETQAQPIDNYQLLQHLVEKT